MLNWDFLKANFENTEDKHQEEKTKDFHLNTCCFIIS